MLSCGLNLDSHFHFEGLKPEEKPQRIFELVPWMEPICISIWQLENDLIFRMKV